MFLKKEKKIKIYIEYKDGCSVQKFYSDELKEKTLRQIIKQQISGTECRVPNENDYREYVKDLKKNLIEPEKNYYFYIDINGKKIELETSKIIKAEVVENV